MVSDQHRWRESSETKRPPITTGWRRFHLTGTRVWRFFEYTGLYLALIAAVEVVLVAELLSLSAGIAPIVGTMITFAVYANDRVLDHETDAVSTPKRSAFVRRYRGHLSVAGAIAYGLGAALAALGGPLAFGIALLPGAVWFVYAADVLSPVTAGFDRLKEVFVVNSLLVAGAWAVSVVLLPIAFANAPITPVAVLLFAYFLLATFVNAEIANVGDVQADTDGGVSTLATTLGVHRTRRVLVAITLIPTLLVGIGAWSEMVSLAGALALWIGLASLVGVVILLGRVERDGLLSIMAECTRLPVFAVVLLLSTA